MNYSIDELCKIREIMIHVSKIFEHYAEDPDYFDEYMDNVLKFDINSALTCFRDVVKQLEWMKRLGEKNDQRQGLSSKKTKEMWTGKLQSIVR